MYFRDSFLHHAGRGGGLSPLIPLDPASKYPGSPLMPTKPVRITKAEWLCLGGLTNPKLSRRQTKQGAWTYWRI